MKKLLISLFLVSIVSFAYAGKAILLVDQTSGDYYESVAEADIEAVWGAIEIYTSDDDYTDWVLQYMIADDSILKAFFADEDWGDMTVSGNTITLDADSVGDNEIDYTAVNMDDMTDGSTNAAITLAQETTYDAVVAALGAYMQDEDINTFSELDAWVTDKELVNADDGEVWSGTHDFTNQFKLQTDKFIVCDTYTSAGINACIDALGSEGGTVYLPEGTYTIDGVITIDYDYTILQGSGWGTYLNASAWSTDHVINLNGKDYCQIQDLQIEGNNGWGNKKSLIYEGGDVKYLLIENCYLHHSDHKAINLTSGSFCKIINNNVFSNDLNGIYVWKFKNGIIANNIVRWSTLDGIVTEDGQQNIIEGNSVDENSSDGISLRNETHTILCANNIYISANTKYDIEILNSDHINVMGNTCKSAAGYSESGISLVDSDYCNIIGNTSSTHDTAGITLDANSNNNHVAWNQLEGETVAKIVDSGSNNTVVNAIASITTFQKLTVSTNLIIPSGTTPAPATEGALFLDTDAGANGTLVMYSNGAWRTIQAF